MTNFYTKCNTGLKWINLSVLEIHQILVKTHKIDNITTSKIVVLMSLLFTLNRLLTTGNSNLGFRFVNPFVPNATFLYPFLREEWVDWVDFYWADYLELSWWWWFTFIWLTCNKESFICLIPCKAWYNLQNSICQLI